MAHFGGRYVGNIFNSDQGTTLVRKFLVTSGVTITKGDFVLFDGSGRLTSTLANGAKIAGVANQTVVGTAAGVTCELICDFGGLYLVNTDASATFAVTDVGKFFDLTGATGAQIVSTTTRSTSPSATVGTLCCVEYNPQIQPYLTTITMGLFCIAKPSFLGYTAG